MARLRQAEQEALTAWTSRLSALQTELQAARLAVRQAEAKRQQAVGQVVDIRVVDVSVSGVTLAVVVDRQSSTSTKQNLGATSFVRD